MQLLTEDAVIVCRHELGRVGIIASQGLVMIRNRKVLVENDPEGRPIVGCRDLAPRSSLAPRRWLLRRVIPTCFVSIKSVSASTRSLA